MPELPEVEVVRAGLAPFIVGATIERVRALDMRALTRHLGADPAEFEARLTGRTVSEAARRGKFLWFPLDDAEALIAHLGMSGQLLIGAPDTPALRHERARLGVRGVSGTRHSIVFVDQRTFGSLAIDDLVETADGEPGGWGTARAEVPSQAAHIARDALDPALDVPAVIRRLRGSTSAVKRLLLDQTLTSGIGNIYADEALWAARIHPETSGRALSVQAVRRLLGEVRAVLRKALAEGGTSFDTQYVNVNGQAGYFAHSLNAYGRGGQPCPRCGRPIQRVSFMNRSSHLCPHCQRRR